MNQTLTLPPLSLYIHIPWCVQKCPYCDFNSHAQKGVIPEQEYIQHLLMDLEQDLTSYKTAIGDRKIHSIFIGGGTPSLFSAEGIAYLLAEIRQRIAFNEYCEITLEANPGTAEAERFIGYAQGGVNRISMGIQSFEPEKLLKLGRIHDNQEAIQAVRFAQHSAKAGLNSFNIDLMHGLPNQSVAQALNDLRQGIALNPPHLSWYQLTIEPNTLFHRHPPSVPDDELALDMQDFIQSELASKGLRHYEVSAYAQPNHECQHNTNYWQFGDYIGIGAGAHGKISQHDRIVRTAKFKHPQRYLDGIAQGNAVETEQYLSRAELPFEYMLNALRLRDGTTLAQMQMACGLSVVDLEPALSQAQSKGLMVQDADVLRVTDLGWRFLSDVQAMFLKDND